MHAPSGNEMDFCWRAANVSVQRLRNDLVDINFAAFATYFDGLLTADEKLVSIHLEAKVWLENIFSVRESTGL